jgi:hypothetical protein
MTEQDREQDLVAAALASAPPPEVSTGFLARVNARIDAERDAGWLALADFRTWTLRLVPAAAALALIAVLWPATASDSAAKSATVTTQTFTPASETDWQQDVSADALLEAALTRGARVR